MRAALSYVTTEEHSASGRVCSLSPTELSWPPETSCFELLLSTFPDAVFFLLSEVAFNCPIMKYSTKFLTEMITFHESPNLSR